MAVEEIDRFLQLRGDEREWSSLLGGLSPDVAGVAEDTVESQARGGCDSLGESHEAIRRRHTGPPHAQIDVDEHADRHARLRSHRSDGLDRRDSIDGHPHGRRAGEIREPPCSGGVNHGIRHQHVAPKSCERRQESLCLADLRHGQPAGLGCQLQLRDFDALVGLRMGPHGDAVRRRVGRQPLDVAADAFRIDHEGGRGDGVDGAGWLDGRHATIMTPSVPTCETSPFLLERVCSAICT